jgi:hypothetical protein
MDMWPKWFFKSPSKNKIIRLLKKEGALIGERVRGGRKIYTYLIRDFFVQIMFKGDNPVAEVEYLETFADLIQLNSHLEKEFKAAVS